MEINLIRKRVLSFVIIKGKTKKVNKRKKERKMRKKEGRRNKASIIISMQRWATVPLYLGSEVITKL